MTSIGAFSVTKGPDDDVTFRLGIRNGPIRVRLMVGVYIEKTDGSHSDWAVLKALKPGDNWMEPHEEMNYNINAHDPGYRGWPHGDYRAWAYLWEALGGPGDWTIGQEMDQLYLADAFHVDWPLPDNVDNISGISHNISQGMCAAPGPSTSDSSTVKRQAFIDDSGGEWQMRYPARVIFYEDYPYGHEIMCAMLKLYNFTGNITVTYGWYRESDGALVRSGGWNIASGSYGWWAGATWLGTTNGMINKKGIYRCDIDAGGWGTASTYFSVE